MTVRQAVLLVGGRGTRLWPLTATTPKGLMPVAGLEFIEYQLRHLRAVGVDEAWLAIGREQAAAWEPFVASRTGVPKVRLSVEDDPLDTAGPVTRLLDRLDERFLVLNGDVIFDAPLAGFVKDSPPAGIVLALARVADPSGYGVVVTADDGVVERFVEKPAPGTAPSDAVNAGLYLVERRALEQFESGPLSFERRVFPDLAAAKELGAVVVDGAWIDIGTPGSYLDTHERIMTGRTRLEGLATSPHSTAADAAVLGERLGAWSWVGPGATVEEGAVLKESVLLAGAVVRSGAFVERAVVGQRSEIGNSAVVRGDSVIGDGCVVGPQCELVNGVRLAPGTKLGPRAISVSPPP